ncbi:Uncharacterized protein dnm_017140 [Desulfonema magnum]|uniref:Uncharacterized protein n=1 Tax=Desulfonema magnum TaxID=45655 RepID=A0A975BI24_9BACT|nr:Uncharacterized protein dnm_017140 [Desulfonema magnum]
MISERSKLHFLMLKDFVDPGVQKSTGKIDKKRKKSLFLFLFLAPVVVTLCRTGL